MMTEKPEKYQHMLQNLAVKAQQDRWIWYGHEEQSKAHKPYSGIHSEGVAISWLCVMHTLLLEHPFPLTRHHAAKIFSHPDVVAEEPWYGVEQEYTLLKKEVHWPLGWPVGGFPGPQVHTIVVLVLTRLLAVTLLTHITKPVFMPASTSVELMEK